MDNSEILSFTKTYRLMAMDLPEMGSVDNAHKDMMMKAIALLTAYGATLDNKDHGANLIHKLLIEGRLAVTLLPDTVRRAD